MSRPAVLVAAGILARLLLLPATSASSDLFVFGSVAASGAQHEGLYHDHLFSYPPLFGYLFLGIGRLLALTHVQPMARAEALLPYVVPNLVVADLTTPVATALLKLPAVLCDAAAAIAAYYVCRRCNVSRPTAQGAALAVWLNPIVIWMSAVQAGWDSAVAAAILCAILAIAARQWFSAAATFAAGVFAKAVPLFALPVLIGSVLRQRGSALAKAILGCVAGGVAVTAILIAPLSSWGELSDAKAALFTRASTYEVGSFNLWSIAWLQPFSGIDRFAILHRQGLGLAVTLVELAGFAALTFAVYASRKDDVATLVLCALAMLALVCVSSPYVQPNYVIWMAPLIAVLGAVRHRAWTLLHWTLSGLAFAFILFVRWWQAVVLPGCYFFRLCDARSFAANAFSYAYRAGWLGRSLQVDIDVVLGELGGIAMVLVLAQCVRGLLARRPQAA